MSEHASFNDLVRRAAGHRVDVAAPEPDVPLKLGSIGIGRGGAAAVRARATSNEDVNRRLRAGFRLVRSAQLRDGVSVDLDDPWR
jgi:hypothetical protein